MSTNNVNVVNTNNWFQKMKTNGNQNVTNMVLSGTNPSVQMTLINSANDGHYLYSNYPFTSLNGFTMSFQFYISGTASNLTRLNAFFGTLDYNVGNNLNGQGGVQVLINPGGYTYGGEGNGHQLQIISTGVSNTWPVTSNNTSVTAGAWQTISITFNPSGTTNNWVVSYNGTTVMTYNYASNVYGNPIGQNSTWGIGATTGATPATVYIRNVDLSIKQSIPLSLIKNTYSFYPEECFLNKLSTHSQTNAAAAFGLRLLKADYLGPIINIRRGSDNATLDFYADSKGKLGTNLYGGGTTLLSWLAGSIGYVTRWYDQTGNGRDVINTTSANQPSIGQPILDRLSSSGKSAARGVYTLYRANSSYLGATLRLRRSADNTTSDFYADVYGNLNNSLTAENAVNTWSARTSNLACQGVTWSPQLGLFAATNYNGGGATTNAIQTSPDGITWTTRTTPSIAKLSFIVWSTELSLFVATSYTSASTSAVITSPDGINWTSRTTPSIATGNGWNEVTWSPQLSLFVCVNNSTTTNTNWVMTSPDGINWTSRTTPSSNNWVSVCWSKELSLFVAVNYNSSTTSAVATSPDGITWTIRTTPSVTNLTRVRWSPQLNLFAAVGSSCAITSPDGINWTSRTVPSGGWCGLVWSAELSIFVATKTDLSTNCIMTSPDGINWTSRTTPSTQCWDITWSPSLSTFVAVNALSTTLITSAQGLIANSTFSSWIGSSTAYVDTWYDQSGSGNNATQSTTANQPIYNGALNLIDSFSSSDRWLNMPSGTVPTGTANAPYSFVFKHGSYNNVNGAFIGAGVGSNNQSNVIRLASSIPNGYHNYWYNNDFSFGANANSNGTTVAITYTGTIHRGYVNGTLSNQNSNHTGGTTTAGQQYLFRAPIGEYLNGQMYSVFIFGSGLSDADRMACTSNPTDLNMYFNGSSSLYIGSTNYPLTSGLKTYTYVADARMDVISGNIVTSGTASNNVRASVFLTSNSYGFTGNYNDAFIVPVSTFSKKKFVMMCNQNLNTGNIVINDNGSIYTGTTSSPSSLNLGSGFYIGTNNLGNELFTGYINELIVFRNTLTTKESQLYFIPSTITRKAYRNKPVIHIKDVQRDNNAIPSGAIVALDSQMLNLSPGSYVSSWNGFTGYNNPVYNDSTNSANSGGRTVPPYISLVNNNLLSSSSSGQYLNAGSKTFNINTNGGFTAIWYGTFTATTTYQRIFDFGNGQNVDNILAMSGTSGTATTLYFYMQNGSGTQYSISLTSAITLNEWAVWTFRYTTSSNLMEILKNGVSMSTGTAGAAITNKTLSNTWIGRSNWTGSDYFANINTVGLYIYDSYLSNQQVATISNHLMYCGNQNVPDIVPEYNNKVVNFGSVISNGYKSGPALYFNGDLGSYIDIQDLPNWPLTFCFWMWNTSTAYTTPAALCSNNGGSSGGLDHLGIQVDIYSNGTLLQPYYSTNGSGYTSMTTSTVSVNAWHHIAFVVTPTTIAYYLNGTLIQSVSAVVYNTNRLIFGKSGDNARPLNGYLQDIRVYDYALRADEITGVINSEERELLNYNTPTNYLVNMRNWTSLLNINKTGSFTVASGISVPNTYYQLTNNSSANSSNTLFNSTRIQNYNSFTFSCIAYVDTVTDHGFYFYCGATSSTTVPTGTAGTSANSCYYIYFQVTGTTGIYLFNDQGQQLAYSPTSFNIRPSHYQPITITYNRSVKNTWTVNVSSQDVLKYDDPNNELWVSVISGDFWGIGARTTTSGMNFYIRRVELSYTPYTNSVNSVVNAQNQMKFPPSAMTADSTTFTGTGLLNGVYIATASSGVSGPPYQAFDNNTGTYWGEPTNVFSGTNGAYTGPQGTNVKNLITGITAGYSGSWLQIQVPNPLQLTSFSLMGRQDQSLFTWRTPNTFYIVGSLDGSTWELIHSTSGAQYTSAMQYFTCNGSNLNKYTYFRIIVNKIGNNGPSGDPGGLNYLDIAAWDLYTQASFVNSNVISVPPYSMTADTTTFTGTSVYDGTYTLTSSNTHSHPNMGPRYTVFSDTNGSFGNVWASGYQYNGSSGIYAGSVSTTVSGVTQNGEWLQIQLPNPIVLYSFSLMFWWDTQSYWLKSFLIAASNDGSTWTNIYDNTNASFTYSAAQTFVVTGAPTPYRYFRLIGRATSGITYCDWWILDQWKLYTNASNVNLMKFPPAPLTAATPPTFLTVNSKNWYNTMNYGAAEGAFTPVLSGTDPLKQLVLSDGSTGSIVTYCNITGQPIMNYDSFTLSFQLYCFNNSNGDHLQLYFGSGGYTVDFLFQIYSYQGIKLNTSSAGTVVTSATNWYNATWNNIRIEYKRGPTNTWTMFFNETQIIQYSDPNWDIAPGSQWGFSVFNGGAKFYSIIRQLDMSINDSASLVGNSLVSGSYTTSASSVYNNILSLSSFNAFNSNIKNTSNSLMWHSALNYSSGTYTGASATTVSGTSYSGDWLQIQTPNPVSLSTFSILPRDVAMVTGTTFAQTPQFYGVAWSPSLSMFSAVGVNPNGASSNGAYSTDGGVTWTLSGISTAYSCFGICWATSLGLFIVAQTSSAVVPTSSNGTTWTYNNVSSSNSWNAVCWSPNLSLAVMVGNSGSTSGAMTSSNGTSWTVRTTPGTNTWRSVCWSDTLSLFVAVGSSNTVMTSPDGITWTARTPPSSLNSCGWRGVAWSPSLKLFCAVSDVGTISAIMTSPDGITWTGRNNPNTTNWQSICWATNQSMFIACGAGGSSYRMIYSYDGINWLIFGTITSPSYRSITWSSELNRAVAVHSTGGTSAAAYSLFWHDIRSPKNFIMAGSRDGSTWDLLHTATGVNDWTLADKYFVCNGSNVANKYTYFRLITRSVGGSNCVNINTLNLYTPITLNNSITPATPKGLLDGLTWKYYNNYATPPSVSYYTDNTYSTIGRCIDTTDLTKITNGQIIENTATYYFSMEIFGYFRASVSGTWTFSLSSDDGSFMWIGPNALSGYTTSNQNMSTPAPNTAITCTVTLIAGTYYPIRIHYQKAYLRNANLTFSFTPPGGVQTYNGQGFFFSGTGLDSAFPQESAKIIKDLTNTNTDGVYYILVNGLSTPIHCLMNDCYDGGGWMMLMKGTRGTTFQYSSSYWTMKNTLNPGDTTRSDADAKYNTFNYSTVKDVLAIFPDISPTSYTNPYGRNGGSIFVNDGWTWMVNNWNETTRTTPFSGFNTTRLPHQNTTSTFQQYGINNPFRYNGFGTWCSSSPGAYKHVFYSTGDNILVRWGFVFNNETADFASCDVFCGIGMGGEVVYSAADWARAGANWGTLGINRTARFEMYGR